jgi:hypothetical protein
MTRWGHEHILERMQKRVEANPAMMKRRQQIVEPPFGTIKRWHDRGYFLMKGLEKVRAAFSVSTLAYNLKRVMTLLGVPYMRQALAEEEKRPSDHRWLCRVGQKPRVRRLTPSQRTGRSPPSAPTASWLS